MSFGRSTIQSLYMKSFVVPRFVAVVAGRDRRTLMLLFTRGPGRPLRCALLAP
jgi:hypothetical protein